jgi:hypothetical protein
MNTVHLLSAADYDEWDTFVTRPPRGLVYHLTTWKQSLENAFGHIRGQFLVLRDGDGQIQAGLPLYIVTSWLLGNRLVSVPFATTCDPCISTREEFNILWPAIEDMSVKYRCRRIEIRTRYTNLDSLPAALTPGVIYKHHYLPLNKSVDELFRSFNESNIRRSVKKAEREGVVIEEGLSEQSLRLFYSVLVATRQKHSLPPIPFAFYQAMCRSLGPDRVGLYLATCAGQPVGGILVSKFKDLWTSEYSGVSSEAIRGVSPLVYWEVIRRAKSNGATHFSFGRTSLDNTGLLIHKRRWATVEEDLTDFVSPASAVPAQDYKSFKIGALAKYTTMAQKLMRLSPSWVCRLIGGFCYRHLG